MRGGEHMTISKVNSDEQIISMLDNTGQLRLRSPLNVFIGGQVLDRGVTLANLIGLLLRAAAQQISAGHGASAFPNVWLPPR